MSDGGSPFTRARVYGSTVIIPCSGVVQAANCLALAQAAPALLAALEELRDAVTEAYKAGRIPAEPFVRAGNVLAEHTTARG